MRVFSAVLLLLATALGCGSSDPDERVERVELTSSMSATTGMSAARSSPMGATSTEPAEAAAPSREPAPDPSAPLYSAQRRLMGTVFVIQVDAPEEVAAPAVERALDEIARLETELSEWQADSDIGRLNRQAGGEPVRVSQDVLRVVEAGIEVGRFSDGAFDISWAALFGLYDFRPGQARMADLDVVRARLPLIDYRRVQIDRDTRTLSLPSEGMAIGTGGIAKGYALDRAGALLREAGIENYMLFGGGQVQVHGQRGDRPWRVGIQHPRSPDDYFAYFEAPAGSISTSGDYEHYFIDPRGQRWHHILDLATGLPARRTRSVTLLAPEGLYADALSTAVFVLGPERGLEMLARLPFRAEAVVVGADCRVHTTPGTAERLHYRMELDEDGRLPACESRP